MKPHFFPKHILNGVFVIMTLAKAFFIVAEFMHLGHEIRNLVMTIAIPACLFIWFLIAFMWDGSSYHDLRMRYDKYQNEQSKTKAKPVEHKEEGKKPGSRIDNCQVWEYGSMGVWECGG